jgi:transcriptional regulator of aromatic amino acid metabolism
MNAGVVHHVQYASYWDSLRGKRQNAQAPRAVKVCLGPGLQQKQKKEGTDIADRNLLALIYERTMYSANHQKCGTGGILFTATNSRLHSRVQPSTTNAMHNQSKQELFLNSFLERLHLVEEAEELASNVLAASLLVVHDTSGGGQDNVTELTGGKELGSPLLEVTELDGVAGVDDTTLVETGEWKLASCSI